MSRRARIAALAVLAAAAVFFALRGQGWLLFVGRSLLRAVELMLSGDTYVLSTMAVSLKVSTTAVALSAAIRSARRWPSCSPSKTFHTRGSRSR